MMSRKTCSRPLPTKVSKVHLHMEQFSLKTDWQAEDSFMIMAVRKTGKAGEEGKRRGRLRPVFLEGNTEEEGGYMCSETPGE